MGARGVKDTGQVSPHNQLSKAYRDSLSLKQQSQSLYVSEQGPPHICVFVCMCVSVCVLCMQMPMGAREGLLIPWSWSNR